MIRVEPRPFFGTQNEIAQRPSLHFLASSGTCAHRNIGTEEAQPHICLEYVLTAVHSLALSWWRTRLLTVISSASKPWLMGACPDPNEAYQTSVLRRCVFASISSNCIRP